MRRLLAWGLPLLVSVPLLLPALWVLVAAVTPTYAINLNQFFREWTWENFHLALASANFPLLYKNTVMYTVGLLLAQLPAVILAAYALARFRFRLQRAIFYLILFQLFLPPVALIVPNFRILTALGLADTLTGVALPYIGSATGVFLLRQGFRQIPIELEEAAQLDGAGPLQTLWYVALPLVKPYIAAFSLVSLVYHWNEFLWPLVVINSPQKRLLSVGFASFTRSAESGAEWGLIAAGAVLVAAPLVVAFVCFQRFFIESFAHTGLRG
ncbi:MAG: ABC transporter permease [Candidatus Tectimicrobiota bacterium]|nr:MAG: ABC transporter permease [Candidatus Tectomicrobia bacterium]